MLYLSTTSEMADAWQLDRHDLQAHLDRLLIYPYDAVVDDAGRTHLRYDTQNAIHKLLSADLVPMERVLRL